MYLIYQNPLSLLLFNHDFSSKDILFVFNAQHNCVDAGCTVSGQHAVIQERAETSNYVSHIDHKSLQSYIINSHSLHTPHLLWQALPQSARSTIEVVALLLLEAKHVKLAQSLHESQKTKQENTTKKRQEKTKEVLAQATELAAAMEREQDNADDIEEDPSVESAQRRWQQNN